VLDCPQFTVKRVKYFTVSSLKDLFYHVTAHVIVDFIKDIGIKIICDFIHPIFNIIISNVYIIVAKMIVASHFYLSYSCSYYHYFLFYSLLYLLFVIVTTCHSCLYPKFHIQFPYRIFVLYLLLLYPKFHIQFPYRIFVLYLLLQFFSELRKANSETVATPFYSC